MNIEKQKKAEPAIMADSAIAVLFSSLGGRHLVRFGTNACRQASKRFKYLLRISTVGIALMIAGPSNAVVHPPWLVYYAAAAPIEAFSEYSLIVLDSNQHPALAPLSAQGKLLLGYISLGEVESFRSHFSEVKAEGILLKENKYWPGSFFVDLRDPRWTRRVVGDLVPEILGQGFDGIFLDTLDNAGHLESTDPKVYAGMIRAAADLVRAIRRHFPNIKIMLNRAYEILPVVEGDIDMVLGESVFADYDFETKKYRRVATEEYQQQVKILQAAKARRPTLRIMTLDYWDPKDVSGIRQIYREQRGNGFEPYVAEIKLNRIVSEPDL